MYYVYGGLYGTRTKFSRRDEWDSHDLSGLISRTQCLEGYTSKVFFFELLSDPRYDFRLVVFALLLAFAEWSEDLFGGSGKDFMELTVLFAHCDILALLLPLSPPSSSSPLPSPSASSPSQPLPLSDNRDRCLAPFGPTEESLDSS